MSSICRNGHQRSESGKCKACAAERMRRRYNNVFRPQRAANRHAKAEQWASPVHTMDACWAAGHFEGEGTVTILKGGRANNLVPRVSVSSTDQQVIEFFCRLWPASSLCHRIPNRNAKMVHTWRVSSAIRVGRFLADIKPHLRTDRVKAKVVLVMEFCTHLLAEQYNRGGDKTWKGPFVDRIRAMNARGLSSGERLIDRVKADNLLPAPDDKVVELK